MARVVGHENDGRFEAVEDVEPDPPGPRVVMDERSQSIEKDRLARKDGGRTSSPCRIEVRTLIAPVHGVSLKPGRRYRARRPLLHPAPLCHDLLDARRLPSPPRFFGGRRRSGTNGRKLAVRAAIASMIWRPAFCQSSRTSGDPSIVIGSP